MNKNSTFSEQAFNSLTWFPVELHIKVALRVVLHPHRDQILLDLEGRNSTKRKKQSILFHYILSTQTHTTGVHFEE